MTANEIMQMFADRKSLNFGPVSGSAWAQRHGNEATTFWITKKQANWVLNQYASECQAPVALHEAEGEIFVDGIPTQWQLVQTSTRSNNGAGMVNLARFKYDESDVDYFAAVYSSSY